MKGKRVVYDIKYRMGQESGKDEGMEEKAAC
jgi:hypothetical protein